MGSVDQALTLGLGFPSSPTATTAIPLNLKPLKQSPLPSLFRNYEPSLTLSLSGETYYQRPPSADDLIINKVEPRQPCSGSAASASSLSNTAATVVVSVKRERETASSEDLDMERGSSRASDDEEDGSGPVATGTRKKLRLTKEQSALLEESFKQHSTLNPVIIHRIIYIYISDQFDSFDKLKTLLLIN